MICEKVVCWPWPCGWLPVLTLTSPVWWTRTTALAHVLPIRPSRPMRGEGPTPPMVV